MAEFPRDKLTAWVPRDGDGRIRVDLSGSAGLDLEVMNDDQSARAIPRGSDGAVLFEVTALPDSVVSSVRERVALAANPDALLQGGVYTRDANDALTAATFTWPDGTAGVFTGAPSAAFPGAIDGWAATYGSPATSTYTQPTMTRNSNGAVTTRPAIVVT